VTPSLSEACSCEMPCTYQLNYHLSGKDSEYFVQSLYRTAVKVVPLAEILTPGSQPVVYLNRTATFKLLVPALDLHGGQVLEGAECHAAPEECPEVPPIDATEAPEGGCTGGEAWKATEQSPMNITLRASSANVSVDPAVLQIPRSGGALAFNITANSTGSVDVVYELNGLAAEVFAQPHRTSLTVQNIMFGPELNFEDYGIGGLDKELQTIIRRSFLSHMVPASVVQQLGISHVRGVLLYGPPGCGKTTIARQIGHMLHTHPPKVVAGPEIMSKFLGESEAKIRVLFADAERDRDKPSSKLHLIIFDEIDALVKPRGRGQGQAADQVYDGVVNTLLSKMDGLEQLNNILVVGTTNRRDLIDEALLRPGRFDIQMEIGLPDGHGRLQILRIHTRHMVENNYLADDVNFTDLAERTESFTGAELEGLVKTAASFAVSRMLNQSEAKAIGQRDQNGSLTAAGSKTRLDRDCPCTAGSAFSQFLAHAAPLGVLDLGDAETAGQDKIEVLDPSLPPDESELAVLRAASAGAHVS
ncbi:hypothetical protein CYMTET_29567, partial [Cymbomonas tetramitiformis]